MVSSLTSRSARIYRTPHHRSFSRRCLLKTWQCWQRDRNNGHWSYLLNFSVCASKIEVLPPIHFTIVAGLLFAVSLGVFMLTSKGEATKTDEELSDLLVGNNPPPQPGLKNYKIQAGALLALTFVIVALFPPGHKLRGWYPASL